MMPVGELQLLTPRGGAREESSNAVVRGADAALRCQVQFRGSLRRGVHRHCGLRGSLQSNSCAHRPSIGARCTREIWQQVCEGAPARVPAGDPRRCGVHCARACARARLPLKQQVPERHGKGDAFGGRPRNLRCRCCTRKGRLEAATPLGRAGKGRNRCGGAYVRTLPCPQRHTVFREQFVGSSGDGVDLSMPSSWDQLEHARESLGVKSKCGDAAATAWRGSAVRARVTNASCPSSGTR